MRKGVTGLNLSFYAVSAFLLAILGQTLLGGLLIGFAIVVEKDEWLTQQTIAAFVLSIASSLVSTILHAFNIFSAIPFLGSFIGKLIDGVTGIVFFVILIICLIAIGRVKGGADANVPFGSKFARWAVNAVPVGHWQSAQQPVYQAPDATQAAGQPQQMQSSQCPNCGAQISAGSVFCVRCGARIEK